MARTNPWTHEDDVKIISTMIKCHGDDNFMSEEFKKLIEDQLPNRRVCEILERWYSHLQHLAGITYTNTSGPLNEKEIIIAERMLIGISKDENMDTLYKFLSSKLSMKIEMIQFAWENKLKIRFINEYVESVQRKEAYRNFKFAVEIEKLRKEPVIKFN